MGSQAADVIEISQVPAQIPAGDSFSVTIRGLLSGGILDSNWSSQVRLRSFAPTAALPVISEIDSAGEAVEVTNPGPLPLDLSNGELQVLTDYGGITVSPNARLRFPPGTVLPPQSTMTWTSRGIPPGAFPNFVSAKRFNSPSSYRLVRFYDSAGRIVDEVYFRTSVSAPNDALWRGAGLSSFSTNVTCQRVGRANHFRAVDWVTGSQTLGQVNPGLDLPWSESGIWTAAVPPMVLVNNGVWTGTIALPEAPPGTNVLKADDGLGVAGGSAPFNILQRPALTLAIASSLQPASETSAGIAGTALLSVPANVASSLPVALSLSGSNEFAVPSQVVIPIGTNSVVFAVTNFDDAVADGAARIVLTATAAGYADAMTKLVNADDEAGLLTVIMPTPLKEDSGFVPESGWVFLNEPARHDVLVQLSADMPIEVPSQVIIPTGRLSQSFPVRVGDDLFVNPQGWQATVRATTPAWPTAEGIIRLTDDEDASFTLTVPTVVVEGAAAVGQIQPKVSRAANTMFTLISNSPRLVVPAEVILPAGALSADFSIQSPDNQQPDAQVSAQLCIQTAGQSSVCKQIIVADDEVNISGLVVGSVPKAVLAGRPFSVFASLVNSDGTPQRTNVAGVLNLLVSPSLAQLAGVTNPIYFTNGIWSNSIAVQGEALDVQLGIATAGYQTNSSRFDIIRGREVPTTFTDVVWHGGLGRFLLAQPAQSNAPARLTEIDPYTGQSGRALNLPRTARRISLSDNGAVAWLTSTQSTLQRVDIAAWQFDREFPIDPGTTNSDPRDLVVLPGESERVVLVANVTNSGWRVILFDRGIGFTNRAALPSSVTSLALAAGRNSGEVFCQSFGYLSRFLVTSNAVTLAISTNVYSASSEWPSLGFEGGWLYRGYGEVYHPDTLVKAAAFATQGSMVGCPFADRGAMLFVEGNNVLKSYNLTTRAAQGSHSLPASVGTPLRLMRWSARGLASFTSAATNLVIFETPLVETNAPDLALVVTAPAIAVLPTNSNASVIFSWQFSVTNRGSVPAFGAQLQLDSGEHFDLGPMPPGAGTTITVQRGSYSALIIKAQASVTCAVPDAFPLDNTGIAVTRVMKPDLPFSKQLVLGMTHLTVSPNGERLYVSVAKTAGELEDGVAVINPATATIEQMLAVGANPQRLAVSDDGSRLYALLGTNTLIRWNLMTSTNEMILSLTNEAVLDFLPVAGSATSLVVATTRIGVYDDLQLRPAGFSNVVTRRYLGYAGGLLWAAEPGQLRPFTITAGGLSAGTPTAFTLFSDYYRFASDGRYLYFSGAVFDTVSRQIVNNSFMGDHFFPEPARGSLYSGVGACLRNYSLTNYTLRAEQCLPQATTSYLQDPVRWGNDGLAARCGGQQLIMVRSPIIPTNVVSDLAVAIRAPTPALPYETLEWTVTLTNRSSNPALRTVLSVSWNDIRDLQLEGPVSLRTSSSFVSDLGDMPPQSAVTFKIRGWCFPGNQTVSASTLVAGSDATPGDNSASVTVFVSDPIADLGIHLVSAPARVAAGDVFDATFVLTNIGPGVANTTVLQLVANPALEFVGVVGGVYPTNASGPLLGTIRPGQRKAAVLRYRAKESGLLPVSAYVGGSVNDSQYGNNRGGTLVYAAPQVTNLMVTEMYCPGAILAWDRSLKRVMAAFPDEFWSLFVLNPDTLEPVIKLPLPGLPEFIAPCNNGRHVWVSLAGGSGVRVDLQTQSVDLQFAYAAEAGPVWAVATPAGQSNLFLAGIDPGWLGNSRVQVFDNGWPRQVTHGEPGWMGGGSSIVFTPEGRLFVAASQHLRELRIVATGLQEIANLDSLGEYDRNSITCVANRLFFVGGRVVDLTTSTATYPLGYVPYLMADRETSLAYLSPQSGGSGSPMNLGCFDARTMSSVWQLPIYLPVGSYSLGSILTMGTNGVLLQGDKLRIVKTQMLTPPAADLRTTLSVAPVIEMAGLEFPIQLVVTNASVWTATGAQLSVSLSPGIIIADGYPGAGTNYTTFNLGNLNGLTNITILARALTNGAFVIQVSSTNTLPDPDPGNNGQQVALTVLPPPVFFLGDGGVAEGSSTAAGRFTAWLSRAAPTSLSAMVTVTPLSAQDNDFNSLSGQFQFSAGQQKATLSSIIKGDSVPELDETAILAFASTNLTLTSTSAVVTLLNDDWPQVTVTNITVNEGNSGSTNATFRVTLSAKAPFATDVFFRTIPMTATAESDFLPREGWLRFEPNEDIKAVPVPVLGDAAYEPAETVAFALLDKTNAELLSAQATLTIRNDDLPPSPRLAVTRLADGWLRFDFDTVYAATYQLQTRTNLSNDTWKLSPTSITGSGAPSSLTLPAPITPETFYRLRVQ